MVVFLRDLDKSENGNFWSVDFDPSQNVRFTSCRCSNMKDESKRKCNVNVVSGVKMYTEVLAFSFVKAFTASTT